IWSDIVDKKLYITGGIGAYHQGVSIRHDLVHEAFGREYELPQRDAYNETCANIANAMWNRRLMQITGDARYADVMERVLYNAALSPMSLDGRTFCYCNPLRRQHGTPLLNHDTPSRLETLSCYCCPPSVARTIAKSAWWAFGVSQNTVWINLYGAGELNTTLPGGAALKMRLASDYPWSGDVTIRMVEAPDEALTVQMRVPGWIDSVAIQVNGQPTDLDAKPGTYTAIKRRWSAGDTIRLQMPMKPTLIESHPLVEANWGQSAVVRGPVVYCAESVDLPDGIAVTDIRLPRDTTWTEQCDQNQLGGAIVLETDAWAAPRSDPAEGLFRRVAKDALRPFRLKLIPYYAWNNRGETEMTVWMPLH
ncbi:MAG: glycoside hydrolase family 127 protein, partial [Planctomycetes bacterium]|nr:glycoside hydrolase family 127 protein [Planctomycetota bacterium]